jgi:hypothetical protein
MIGLPDLGLALAGGLADLIGPVVAVGGFIVQYTTRPRG